MKKERLKEIDMLRAIAFIFVVAQHTVGCFSNCKGVGYTVLNIIYVIAKTAVPIFLFISAFSLFYVYFDNVDWKNYYTKRIKYVIIPYAIWSAIHICISGNTEYFKHFIIELIAGNGRFHLWYMGMIIRVYLIFPVIFYITKWVHALNIKIRVVVFLSFLPLYYMISKYQNVISHNIGSFIFKNPTPLQQRSVNISILFWFLYFVLGIYASLNYEYIKIKIIKYKHFIILIFSMLLVYAYLNEVEEVKFVRSFYLLYVIFAILTFYIVALALANRKKCYGLLKYISDYSYGSYLVHVIVINGVTAVGILIPSISYVFLRISALIIGSIGTPMLIHLINHIKYSEYLTGVKRKSIGRAIKAPIAVEN